MSHSRDPRWTVARYDGKCSCGAAVKRGDRIFYYPADRTVAGSRCGCADTAQADFDAAAFDEAVWNG